MNNFHAFLFLTKPECVVRTITEFSLQFIVIDWGSLRSQVAWIMSDYLSLGFLKW